MDRLSLRLADARQALSRLDEVLRLMPGDAIVRDAAIKRFEFSFDTAWKAAQAYLTEVAGIESASPKAIIRQCRLLGLLDEDQTSHALGMVDDRNLSSHTYREQLAAALALRLPGHFSVLAHWVGKLGEVSR